MPDSTCNVENRYNRYDFPGQRFLMFAFLGVLTEIEGYFGIDHNLSGLLQTVFIASYMILAPIFGYLGDRFNRKIIMTFGLVAWSLSTFAGTLVHSDVRSIIST